MIKQFILLLFIGLVWGRTTVAIFDFENNGIKPYEVRQLSTRLESELVIINKYNVVERSKIDEILKEQKLQMSGCVEECLIEIGSLNESWPHHQRNMGGRVKRILSTPVCFIVFFNIC